MLTRKSPFAQGENDRTIMQDGFSAPVESAPRLRFSSACAMVGRRVMDFSDNGDGTLTAVRCVDRQADDLDIQFEAGACPVVAIAPRAFEGCAALRRVILPESLRQIGEMAFSGCSHLRLLTIPGGVQRVGTLEDLCRGCDYLTVHVPSKADTIGMISTEQIDLLAPNAVLINYARETIIDEDAVDAALREGKLSWFSCDFATPKTVKMPNTFITTHSGAGTGEAEANCADMAISELKDYLENGNIAHSVNYPACSMGKARAASRIACLHANVPNMIGQITAILAKDNANVQRMTNESAGENAYTMFDTDEHLDSSTIEALKQIPSMYRVRVIK